MRDSYKALVEQSRASADHSSEVSEDPAWVDPTVVTVVFLLLGGWLLYELAPQFVQKLLSLL